MTFLSAAIDWFTGARSGHMGPEQYAAHKGMRNGEATSGALLWQRADTARKQASTSLVSAETALLNKASDEIARIIPSATPIIELGPGTTTAFRDKTLPIISKIAPKKVVIVDESVEFLKQLSRIETLPQSAKLFPVIDDFFANDIPYLDSNDPALICSFGSTISNVINPVSSVPPVEALTNALSSMKHAASGGWMIVAFDTDQDGDNVKAYFNEHSLFQLNFLDRMAVELPIAGDFNPLAFDYEPDWIPGSGQLAHMSVVKENMTFEILGRPICLKKGQRLHIKNSYKYKPSLFEACCHRAKLDIIQSWSDHSTSRVYLLGIPPIAQIDTRMPRRTARQLLLEAA